MSNMSRRPEKRARYAEQSKALLALLFILEVRDKDCLTNTGSEKRKRKLAIVSVSEKTVNQLLHCGIIKIGGIICRIRTVPTRCI